MTGRDDFGPYGEKIASYDLVPRDYALHVSDPNALLFHAPYRDYAAGWARWTTRDPLGMVDGPNEYSYVGDGPTLQQDALGLYLYPNGPFGDFKPHPSACGTTNFSNCFKNCMEALSGNSTPATTACGLIWAACLASKNPYACAAEVGCGVIVFSGIVFCAEKCAGDDHAY